MRRRCAPPWGTSLRSGLLSVAALRPCSRVPPPVSPSRDRCAQGRCVPRCARAAPALDCEPPRRGCVWEAVRCPKIGGPRPAYGSRALVPWCSAPAGVGAARCGEGPDRHTGTDGPQSRSGEDRPPSVVDVDSPLGRRRRFGSGTRRTVPSSLRWLQATGPGGSAVLGHIANNSARTDWGAAVSPAGRSVPLGKSSSSLGRFRQCMRCARGVVGLVAVAGGCFFCPSGPS